LDGPRETEPAPLRIALVTETFLPKVDGVVTRLVATLAALEELGHEVLVLAPPGSPERCQGARVVAAGGLPFPWYPEHTFAVPSSRIARAVDDFAPHVVHVVNPILFGTWGAVHAKRRGLPLLASFHTDPKVVRSLSLGWAERPLEVLDREVHNLAHVNLCTSPQMVELARGLGIRRVRLWPKAVDAERFHPGRRSAAMRARLAGGEDDAPLVVYAGRVSFEKRVDVLAEAVHALRGEARFAVVGEGPARPWLEERLAGTGTVFTGFLSGDELGAAYASADVFAFPSDSETLGFAALEAMAAGVPVVAARAGGLPHVVEDGRTGLLVAPGSGPALAEGIRRLIGDGRLRERLAGEGRREAERWSWTAATRALVDHYRKAMRLRGMEAARRR
jgi:glycosyltransferase involved in cell wall biosynthesis